MDLGIAGRNAIVCASSKGLGFASANALAREGVNVVLNGRDETTLAAARDRILKEHSVRVMTVTGDITQPATQQALLAACPEPDILVNNNGGP
ncbi:MAG: SDR family NAD(P)-dependent oxidoreductase, partial [Actinobacteria bacterium]|nr:SDR family NAD(P)-dependent oxidoreductase [Actinomycetota bacterium]